MASDVLYCVLFATIVIGIHAISQSKYDKTNNVLYMKQNVAIESHSRKRRDVSVTTEQNSTDFHFKHEFVNETKFTLAITWAGENNGKLIVVVTDEELMSVRQPTIYQSVDDGKTFTDIGSRVGQALLRKDNGLQVHPFNREKVYLIAWVKDSKMYDMWTSSNGGDSFTKYSMPFRLDGSLTFHPHALYMDRILAHDISTLQLWLSVNGGASWKSIASNVVTFKWDDQTTSNDTIFAVVDQERDAGIFGGSPERYKLTKSIDLGEKWTDIHMRLVTFGVAGQFLFVTAVKPGNSDEERFLEVSQDGGLTWAEVQLPTLTSDRFYSIVDMAEGVVMIHVDNPGDTGHGTLYISDATGIVFSESLPRHLYPNAILGEDVTDFYRVQSLRGVYLASQMEADNSIHTMISFNRGGRWSAVKRPTVAPCADESKACYLQIHNQYSMSRDVRVPQGPYSTDSAVGVILVHGVVADGLQTAPPDVFVSSDGGYTWIKALDGPHFYQIVDQGGLLVAVSAAGDTADTIKYSTDVGQTWDSFKFTEETFVVTGLLTEPGNRAMSVAIWGYTSPNRTWQVHTLNFTTLLSRQCEESDYEPWVAHWDSSDDLPYKGCLLGRKQTYERLKKNSKCYNGRSKDVTRTTEEKCLCTKDDYDCDYGYYRDDFDSCVLDPQFKGSALEICDRGHVEEIVTEGYHKDPGDVCEGGFSPTGKRITLAEECTEGDKSFVKKEMHIATPDDNASSHTATSLALVFVSIVVGVVGVVLILFFVGRYRRLQLRQSLHYRLLHSDRPRGDAADQSLLDDHSDEESQRTPLRGGGGHASSGALRTDDEPLWSQSPSRNRQRNLAESDVELLE